MNISTAVYGLGHLPPPRPPEAPRTYRLVIPLEIPSQNVTERGRSHFARAHCKKVIRTEWRIHGHVERLRMGLPIATGIRSMLIVAYRKRLCADEGNLVGGAKACIDGLVDAGLLVDDKKQFARITYEQHLCRLSPTKAPATVLLITDL